ncbi:MAG: MBG domain-containing protein, partial [Verrucomicrobiales bacterium]
GTLVIAPATATVTLGDLAQTYDSETKSVTATTEPADLSLAITYDGGNTTPSDAGSYAVVATITAPNYSGSASGTLVIAPATATVTLDNLAQTYDGNPKPVIVTTDPEGLTLAITYDGSTAAPTDAGSYALVATITDPNYVGSASGTLGIEASYLSWVQGFSALAPDVQLDSDGDGWSNLAEYLFDTNPLVRSSAPSVTAIRDGGTFQLQVSPNPVARPDAILGAQTSTDLSTWTTEGVTSVANGFSTPDSGLRRFMKLTFSQSP